MKDKKIFSIIVPVYNAENTIERTLASFISNKDYINDVILVDDKSTDDTFDKIDIFRNYFNIRIINNKKNRGPGFSRKIGLLNALGDWVTFVDADDCLTPTSLKYVYDKICEDKKVVLLHTKSIYYESGNFNSSDINYSDTSCGGNFYNKKYLIKNRLYPHDSLYMAEDEYLNEVVIKFIDKCDIWKHKIDRFDYPVYEVHHDIDEGLSFALSNWGDYCCKYHLMYKKYVGEYFIKYKKLRNEILYELYDEIIFVYFLVQGLILDDDIDFILEDNIKYFRDYMYFIENAYSGSKEELIKYYDSNAENVNELMNSAIGSVGFEFDITIPFDMLINWL